jgi:hypothetical protein
MALVSGTEHPLGAMHALAIRRNAESFRAKPAAKIADDLILQKS